MRVRDVSEKLTQRLCRKKIIEHDSQEIYQYGIEQLLNTMINMITIVIIGIIFGEVWQSILLTTAFRAIRIYAGGYHASTPIRCYLLMIGVISIELSVVKNIEINFFICMGLLVIASVIILLLSPVETENKPLDKIERIIFRQKVVTVWGIEIIVAVIVAVLGMKEVLLCIMVAQLTISISLVAGWVKLKTCNT